MPIPLKDVPYGKLLEKNYERALSISNRYSFINANLLGLLKKEDQQLLLGFQDVCKKLVKESHQHRDDIYPLFPKLGEHHMIQRMNPYDGVEGSTLHQMLLSMAMVQLAPELDMGVVASGILVGNALFHNPDRTDIQQKALEEIYSGKAVGGIGITEPERGSDAVNMQLKATLHDDGSFTYNGTKIYTTNGAVADYYATYGVTDESDPRKTMMLGLFLRGDEGLSATRLSIPAAPGVGIGMVKYDNVHVAPDRMIAEPGEGYKRLFRGLTPERIAIIGSSIAGIWGALATGTIYTQIRTQFGKPLFKYQGISHVLADLYAKAASHTAFAFQICDFYDRKVASKIHKGEKPDPMDEGLVAVMAAQGKYLTARLAHWAAYEVVQLMGGRGALDEVGSNNGICRGENLSRISEVVGGHRNIQLMIIEMGLRATSGMAIASNIEKAKRQQKKEQKRLIELTVARAEKLLQKDGDYMGEMKGELEKVLNGLKKANEEKDKILIEAYSKALPKVLRTASKAAYKAKKAQNK